MCHEIPGGGYHRGVIEQTVVISGATSGIGAVAAEALASRGARLVFTARSVARGEATLARLKAIAPQADHRAHYGDLSSPGDIRRMAAEIAAHSPRIDVLINNAGMIARRRELTPEGLESTFAVNHLACFMLSGLLKGQLVPAARIVVTSSAAHARAALDLDDLQLERGFTPWRAYSNSKLCNLLFTRELARRLSGTAMSVNAFHPGFVDSGFGDTLRGAAGLALRAAKYFALTPRQGAQTLIHLASADEVRGTSGAYFVHSRIATPSAAARDDSSARRLWAATARIAGVDW